jgi:hypothetical protein
MVSILGGKVKTKLAIIVVHVFIVLICAFTLFSSTALTEPICGVRPDLNLTVSRIYWASFADYADRSLSVEYNVTNTSTSDALEAKIVAASGSNNVTHVMSLPKNIGSIPGGGNLTFAVMFNVPDGVTRFTSLIRVNAEDGCGTIHAYPEPSPLIEAKIVGSAHDSIKLRGADGLQIQGDYAYIAAGGANRLTIVDVSVPTSPTIIKDLTDPYGRLDNAYGLDVSGNYAYVVTGYSGTSDRLTVVDISNPSAPIIVGSLQDTTNLDGALHIYVSGQYAYISAPFNNRMTIIDISVPENPRLVSSVQDHVRLYRADGIYHSADHVFVTTHQLDGGSDKSYLTAINVADPNHPFITGSINSSFFRGGDQMHITGRYLYAPGNVDHTFTVVDIADPSSMNIVSHITDHAYIGVSCFVYVSGKYAFVTGADVNRLTIIDIADPTAPRIIASITDTYNLASALYVVVEGRYAYVTSPAGALTVVEISGMSI